uniref:E3 ubiquitin-protein ligase RNF31-like n=1 Tax=Sphaeramia orbicularis TaxID=375764 RepID=A0A673CWN9_9TELE
HVNPVHPSPTCEQSLKIPLSILEKYGCNLASPTRPKYWRSVKHNNPVFRTTVDAVKGGRTVLYLYGYTNQQIDGLSFPDEVTEPDIEKVAAVTLEVMILRTEVDMIIKVCNRLSDSCKYLSPFIPQSEEQPADQPQVLSSSPKPCNLCGGPSSLVCPSCDSQSFCDACDDLFHRHPARATHKRDKIQKSKQGMSNIDALLLYVHYLWCFCDTCSVLDLCPETMSQLPSLAPWECAHCTTVNEMRAVLCTTCERPRLATAASIVQETPASPNWTCQFCTYVNTKPTAVCEMCNLSCKDSAGVSLPQSLQQTPTTTKDPQQPGMKPQPKPRVNPELKRQKLMKEEGLSLINHIREAEKRGVSPEEVYAALCMCGGSNVNPCDWLMSELPHLLDEICAMAQISTTGEGVKLSRAEAKLAWLAAGGDTERAVKQLLRDRQVKMRELHSLGFRDVAQCEEALRQSGGEVKGALSLLQRPLLEPFHQRIWANQPEPPIDPKHPDKQRMCRRLLALYDLPSWGRCELVLSLLQDPGITYTLEDVVQAVKESHDKDFIRRLLNNECPCCLSIFPRSKMQSLTSCQCSVCHECFGQHFTVAVRDKHIRDMVCPVCSEPDINDQEQLDSYFSTLDIQLRDCLEHDVYDLFHKKLTEHALMKDPKFLWCCHCTSGFINDGDHLKVTCPSCRKSFCAQCKKPWEPQHQDLSCEQFQQWKRENDPEYQRQGLAGYLRDNGITCPHCRFQYALTKGGCMHFTCSQCRYQFCSGCNNPYHKTACKTPQCNYTGLHAHHPRDCLFYLRDWEPARLQALLQKSGVEFNTDPSNETQTANCGVMEQKDEGGLQIDSPCGLETRPGQAGLCEKHYREYLVSLINAHSLDPAPLYDAQEVTRACERYQVDTQRGDEDDNAYYTKLLKKLMEVPLGEKVPRNK